MRNRLHVCDGRLQLIVGRGRSAGTEVSTILIPVMTEGMPFPGCTNLPSPINQRPAPECLLKKHFSNLGTGANLMHHDQTRPVRRRAAVPRQMTRAGFWLRKNPCPACLTRPGGQERCTVGSGARQHCCTKQRRVTIGQWRPRHPSSKRSEAKQGPHLQACQVGKRRAEWTGVPACRRAKGAAPLELGPLSLPTRVEVPTGKPSTAEQASLYSAFGMSVRSLLSTSGGEVLADPFNHQ
jgi:hypothetical protein